MKNIIIVESPSKSKTIKGYLGKDFEVVSSKGHIRDLATNGKYGLGVDVENDFQPTYKEITKQKENIKNLKNSIKGKKIYLATDLDREGEAISWHLADALGIDLNDKNRIVFNEITKKSILDSIKHPRKIDMNLVHSQESRRILDRIIGFRLSSLLRYKIGSQSAGRVQSVALRFIVEREKEIKEFKPEEYWSISLLHKFKKKEIVFKLSKYKNKVIKLISKEDVDKVLSSLDKKNYNIKKITDKIITKNPPIPYTTSKLQQEASNKLGFTPKKTMLLAQKLYEGIKLPEGLTGLITYIRTDSIRMSSEFITQSSKFISEKYGKEYVKKVTGVRKKAVNVQDAHECIRPTSVLKEPEKIKDFLTNDEYKLYNLIWIKSVCHLMTSAKIKNINIQLESQGYTFITNGYKIHFDGYLKIANFIENHLLLELPSIYKEGDIIKNKDIKIDPKQHFTKPHPRYTSSSLIKKLEEEGIGRPSTYVSIIDTLQKRMYTFLENKSFIPSEQGILTIDRLIENFDYIVDPKYTAKIEKQLDEIAYGNLNEKDFLMKFYNKFSERIEEGYINIKKIYPKETDKICPECSGNLVINKGRFGEFLACSNFPNCHFSESLENNDLNTNIKCPKCNKAYIFKKFTKRRKIFYGCSSYPDCDFAIWYKPINKECSICGSIMCKKGKSIVCSNKDCK